MKRYEAMFLLDNTAVSEWPEMESEVRRLCDRIGAQVQVCLKFDDRKLAYEIDGRKRGTYVLTYFDAPAERIGELERDAQLSEVVLRHLVLRAPKVTDEKLDELRKHPVDKPLSPHSDGRHGDSRPGGFRSRRGEPRSEAKEEPKRKVKAEAKSEPGAGAKSETSAATEATEPEAASESGETKPEQKEKS